MQFSEETLDWAVAELSRNKHMRGFPEAEGLEAVAAAMLRIAHPVLVQERRQYIANNGIQSGFTPTPEMINPGAEALAAVRCRLDGIGDVNPMRWILDLALDDFAFFPAPVELRRIFTNKFPTADGKSAPDERGQ